MATTTNQSVERFKAALLEHDCKVFTAENGSIIMPGGDDLNVTLTDGFPELFGVNQQHQLFFINVIKGEPTPLNIELKKHLNKYKVLYIATDSPDEAVDLITKGKLGGERY